MEHFMLNALTWTPETSFPRLALTRNEGPSAGKTGEAQDGGWGGEDGFPHGKWCRAVRMCKVGSPIVAGEPKWSPDVREKHTGLPANGGPAVGRKQGLADCPSRSSFRLKLGPSPSTARAAQRWPAGVRASTNAGSVSPGCFPRVSPCMPVCIFEPATGPSSFCRSPFSAAAAASTLLARLSGWASKWQVVIWLSTFPNRAPTANPTWACGYPRVFPLPPQPLGKLPHLFLCGQRSSGSAGIWTHCWGPCQAGEGACTPRRAWEAGPHLANSNLGPIGHHPAREFVRQGCWRKPPSIRTWAHPRPNPRQDHHLVGPAWVLNQIGVSACPLHWSPHVPTTGCHGKVWRPVSLAMDIRLLWSRESGRNWRLSRLPNKPPASPWSLVT